MKKGNRYNENKRSKNKLAVHDRLFSPPNHKIVRSNVILISSEIFAVVTTAKIDKHMVYHGFVSFVAKWEGM